MSTSLDARIKRTVATMVGAAALAASIGVVGATNAHARTPMAGEPCPVLHEMTWDGYGEPMWCNPMMTGTHDLVWQYGGPA